MKPKDLTRLQVTYAGGIRKGTAGGVQNCWAKIEEMFSIGAKEAWVTDGLGNKIRIDREDTYQVFKNALESTMVHLEMVQHLKSLNYKEIT